MLLLRENAENEDVKRFAASGSEQGSGQVLCLGAWRGIIGEVTLDKAALLRGEVKTYLGLADDLPPVFFGVATHHFTDPAEGLFHPVAGWEYVVNSTHGNLTFFGGAGRTCAGGALKSRRRAAAGPA